MSKDKYTTLEIDIVEFEAEDVITASVEGDELPFIPIKP